MTRFRWRSGRGVGTAIFIAVGAIHVLFGSIGPLGAWRVASRFGIVLFSPRTDAALFHHDPAVELLSTDPAFANLQTAMSYLAAGPMLGLGIAEIAVAWFGLRRGERWAWGAIVLAQAALIPSWMMLVQLYLREGAPLAVSDIPPFMLWPAIALVPAAWLARPRSADPLQRAS